MFFFRLLIFTTCCLALFFALELFALEKPKEELADLSMKTVLGAPIDGSLEFTNAKGEKAQAE